MTPPSERARKVAEELDDALELSDDRIATLAYAMTKFGIEIAAEAVRAERECAIEKALSCKTTGQRAGHKADQWDAACVAVSAALREGAK